MRKGRLSIMLKHSWLCAAMVGIFFVSEAKAQGLTQVACRVVIQRTDDAVTAFAVAQVSQPTKVDYELRMVKMSSSGMGASEQTGAQELRAGEATVVARVSADLEADGWLEFELEIQERLTGATCSATEAVSPL